MSTPDQFVAQLFERVFFQDDATLAISTFETDVAADAKINYCGKDISAAEFLAAIKVYHSTAVSRPTAPQEALAVTPLGSSGKAGVVAHLVKTKHTTTATGAAQTQVSVAIIKVEERGGKQVITSWVEALQVTPI
ncbi:hypothetical protein FB451DRAFT_1372081 [Mycena latifolia]|nr:hypothetical protein FB451DRAFT_1372081 [Mycena latifolia]